MSESKKDDRERSRVIFDCDPIIRAALNIAVAKEKRENPQATIRELNLSTVLTRIIEEALADEIAEAKENEARRKSKK